MTSQHGPSPLTLDSIRAWLNRQIRALRLTPGQDDAQVRLSALYVSMLIEIPQIHTRGQIQVLKKSTQELGLMPQAEFDSLFGMLDALYPKLELTKSTSEANNLTDSSAATFTPALQMQSVSSPKINHLRRTASTPNDPDFGEATRISRTASLEKIGRSNK